MSSSSGTTPRAASAGAFTGIFTSGEDPASGLVSQEHNHNRASEEGILGVEGGEGITKSQIHPDLCKIAGTHLLHNLPFPHRLVPRSECFERAKNNRPTLNLPDKYSTLRPRNLLDKLLLQVIVIICDGNT